MDQLFRLRNELCDNLILLSIKQFIYKRKLTFDAKPDSLKKLSQNDFQTITYFLFETLDSNECKNRFKACFPVLDRKQESEFRQITHLWLQQIAEKEKECNFPRIVAFYFQNLCGEAFLHLYLEFSNYVIMKVIERKSNLQSIECHFSRIDLIEDKTEIHFNEYQNTKVEIKEETQKWIHEMQYFITSYNKLLEDIKTWDQNKIQVLNKINSNFGSEIDSNELFIEYLKKLENEVQVLRHNFISFNDSVNKKWKFYLNSFKTKNNSSFNYAIDLNNSFTQITNDFNSFVDNVDHFLSLFETYDTIIENSQNSGNDLITFSENSKKLLKKVAEHERQLVSIAFKLKSKLNQFRNTLNERRSELIKSEEIIERRKWFAERIPDLTKINFKFGPKRRKSIVKDVDNICKSSKACSESSIFDSPSAIRELNYSFKPIDMSSCEYIPPSGSLQDSKIFSPIESTKHSNF